MEYVFATVMLSLSFHPARANQVFTSLPFLPTKVSILFVKPRESFSSD